MYACLVYYRKRDEAMKSIVNFIKGILIGIAVVIPGLSGSIFAVVVGLYERLIYAVSHFRQNVKKNLIFLLPIALGGIIGILLSAKLILWVCEEYTQEAYFFFIGLVIGSFPLMIRKMTGIAFRPRYLLITAAAFIVMTGLSYLSSAQADSGYIAIREISGIIPFLTVLLAGAFSCSLMSVPGVSGSVLLMVIGQYGTVYYAVGQCTDWLKYMVQGDFSAAQEASAGIFVALLFAAGAAVGFVLISKLLSKLLERAEALTYYGVTGMVCGAIVTLFWQGVLSDASFTGAFHGNFSAEILFMLLFDILLVGAGIFCTNYLDK